MTAVKMLVSVVAAAMADGDSNGDQNRVSGSSGGDSGYGGGRQHQKLRGHATINKMWQVAVAVAESGVVAAVIAAAQLQRQAGVAARQK